MATDGKFPLVSLILSAVLISIASSSSCYWRDGSEAIFSGNKYTPCTNNLVSMCCLLALGDTCMPQGLCKSSDGTYYRNACTDSTWTSTTCLSLCPDVLHYAQLTLCADGSFCCPEDSTCCATGKGVYINSNGVLSSHGPSPTSTASPLPSSTSSSTSSSEFTSPTAAWQFLVENSWLATPIVALIGWINTWIIAAALLTNGEHYGDVADRRYTSLAKRTVMAAHLADKNTSTPKQVIGCVTMDPGLSTQLEDLDDCKASVLSYISWIVQLGTTIYAIFIACFVWTQDSLIRYENAWVQFPLLFGVLNINRGTWAIAVLGCVIPGRRKLWLVLTTVVAVLIDVLFITRAFIMAWHINDSHLSAGAAIASWIPPSLEASLLMFGLIAAYFKVPYIAPKIFIFLPAAAWLVLGPLVIIGVSVTSHFFRI